MWYIISKDGYYQFLPSQFKPGTLLFPCSLNLAWPCDVFSLIKSTGDNVLELLSSGLERPWSFCFCPFGIQAAWIKAQSKRHSEGVMKQEREGRERGEREGEVRRRGEKLGPHEPQAKLQVILKRLYVEQKNHPVKSRKAQRIVRHTKSLVFQPLSSGVVC